MIHPRLVGRWQGHHQRQPKRSSGSLLLLYTVLPFLLRSAFLQPAGSWIMEAKAVLLWLGSSCASSLGPAFHPPGMASCPVLPSLLSDPSPAPASASHPRALLASWERHSSTHCSLGILLVPSGCVDATQLPPPNSPEPLGTSPDSRGSCTRLRKPPQRSLHQECD